MDLGSYSCRFPLWLLNLLISFLALVFITFVMEVSEDDSVTNVPVRRKLMFSCQCSSNLDLFFVCPSVIDAYVRIERTMDLIRNTLYGRSSLLLLLVNGYSCILVVLAFLLDSVNAFWILICHLSFLQNTWAYLFHGLRCLSMIISCSGLSLQFLFTY